jgi:arylsulfatase A
LFDMSKAPFEENLVASVSQNKEASDAKLLLAAALKKLNPEGGILDQGDGTGRHANKAEKNAVKNKN